jgi:hypothetical protein
MKEWECNPLVNQLKLSYVGQSTTAEFDFDIDLPFEKGFLSYQ